MRVSIVITALCLYAQNILPFSVAWIAGRHQFRRFRNTISRVLELVKPTLRLESATAFEEVQSGLFDDAPAVLTDDICLIPGDPVVRVEEAPGNARRIFTGIDISSSIDNVWATLTEYENLHNVVPSLVENRVLEKTERGARLFQIGGANVLPGVTFKATCVLDVVTYLEHQPMPANITAAHLGEDASSLAVRSFDMALPLVRGVFPRPYSETRLPHRDITMMNVLGQGDFDHYQGVWRCQNLPNCAPNGGNATRLTYALELKPKGLLPVKLIEGRIASDLANNLIAIRNYVERTWPQRDVIVPSPEGRGDGTEEDVLIRDAGVRLHTDRPEVSAAIAALQRGAARGIATLLTHTADTQTHTEMQTGIVTLLHQHEFERLRRENAALSREVSALQSALKAERATLDAVRNLLLGGNKS